MKTFITASIFALGFTLVAYGLSCADSFDTMLTRFFYELPRDGSLFLLLTGISLTAYGAWRLVTPDWDRIV